MFLMFNVKIKSMYSWCVCVYRYLSSSSLDTPSLSLGDQSRGDGGVSLNEKELNAWFRVVPCIQNDLVSSKILPVLNSLGPGKIDSKFRL